MTTAGAGSKVHSYGCGGLGFVLIQATHITLEGVLNLRPWLELVPGTGLAVAHLLLPFTVTHSEAAGRATSKGLALLLTSKQALVASCLEGLASLQEWHT